MMIAYMPTGVAGANGLARWCALDEPAPVDHRQVGTPPLLLICLLKQLDAVIETARLRMTLRNRGVATRLTELPSGHQSASLMQFDTDEGLTLPPEELVVWATPSGMNPFSLYTEELHESSEPVESRLDVITLMERWQDFTTEAELEQIGCQEVSEPA